MHFFFYGLAVTLYTAAVFVAGMYLGEKFERMWQRGLAGPRGTAVSLSKLKAGTRSRG